LPTAELTDTFDRQLQTLLDAGYPGVAGLSEDAFVAQVAPLRTVAANLPDASVVLVVAASLVAPERAIDLVEWEGRSGFTSMAADDLARFGAIPEVEVPSAPVYLLTGVETGAEFRGVRPDDALPTILGRDRSPLTLDEGLAVVTHHPGILREQTCFQMLASRCGDKRVTGLWVSAKRPRLGWCWGGNPHDWLGMASCAGRVSA
jgi:hypothetical protein